MPPTPPSSEATDPFGSSPAPAARTVSGAARIGPAGVPPHRGVARAVRVASWIAFVALMAVILPASLAGIVFLYAPYVCLRAIYLMATGKVKPRFLQTPAERERMDRPPPTREGPVPF
jgi:hypothetical protein